MRREVGRLRPGTCFNPRPPVPGGDAQAMPTVATWIDVSIHAPRFREAMPVRRRQGRRHVLVSIHAPRFREAMQCEPCHGQSGRTVSIHAPRFREAMPGSWSMAPVIKLFQSTPPVSGRRCPAVPHWRPQRHRFQSTPPVSGRRCARWFRSARRAPRFNPRPPFPGGDACRSIRRADWCRVSIHAPRFREAMRLRWFSDGIPHMFQSTPPVSGRRCRQRVLSGRGL